MPDGTTVLFVCLHGAAKSVVAARHLERLAAARNLEVRAQSAGVDPDPSVPSHVVAGLASDGLVSPAGKPQPATPELIESADVVVTFGCDVTGLPTQGTVVRWDDVPAVSDGYDEARNAIVSRLPALLDTIARVAAAKPVCPWCITTESR
jgi:protein-tyrosine-phosphatase